MWLLKERRVQAEQEEKSVAAAIMQVGGDGLGQCGHGAGGGKRWIEMYKYVCVCVCVYFFITGMLSTSSSSPI